MKKLKAYLAAPIFTERDRMFNSFLEKEILYLFSFYKDLSPKVLLLYDRTAFVDTSSDLRITFDKNVRFRLNDINLRHQMNGENIFNNGGVLSEVKTSA